uniref:LCN-type CS-alpha/beta domain-containing protein n=1 Tax=Isometrus maculatus TaxID=497827 RepID=A0A0U1SCD9_ISOMC|nr:hypothetical protein [Isometrus maculatus]
MKTLLLIALAVLFIEEVRSKDGYLMETTGRDKGCKIWCVINNESCNTSCTMLKGKKGYCYFWKLACYCEGLPENVQVWTYEKNTCKAK